jgi:hypothetical protein
MNALTNTQLSKISRLLDGTNTEVQNIAFMAFMCKTNQSLTKMKQQAMQFGLNAVASSKGFKEFHEALKSTAAEYNLI